MTLNEEEGLVRPAYQGDGFGSSRDALVVPAVPPADTSCRKTAHPGPSSARKSFDLPFESEHWHRIGSFCPAITNDGGKPGGTEEILATEIVEADLALRVKHANARRRTGRLRAIRRAAPTPRIPCTHGASVISPSSRTAQIWLMTPALSSTPSYFQLEPSRPRPGRPGVADGRSVNQIAYSKLSQNSAFIATSWTILSRTPTPTR